jgi:hypothetical protein
MALHPTMRATLVALYGEDNVALLERAEMEGAPTPDPDELVIVPDEAEAERFRIELERDERGPPIDWPDGS